MVMVTVTVTVTVTATEQNDTPRRHVHGVCEHRAQGRDGFGAGAWCMVRQAGPGDGRACAYTAEYKRLVSCVLRSVPNPPKHSLPSLPASSTSPAPAARPRQRKALAGAPCDAWTIASLHAAEPPDFRSTTPWPLIYPHCTFLPLQFACLHPFRPVSSLFSAHRVRTRIHTSSVAVPRHQPIVEALCQSVAARRQNFLCYEPLVICRSHVELHR